MTSGRTISTWTSAALVVGATLLLSGCTFGSDGDAPSSSTPSTPVEGQLPGQPNGVVGATTLPSDIPNDPAVRTSVTVDDCSAVDAGWSAKGTARNAGDADASYTVTVFFADSSSTVLGSGQATVDVPAGGEASWSLEDAFVAPDDTTCVLRGVG